MTSIKKSRQFAILSVLAGGIVGACNNAQQDLPAEVPTPAVVESPDGEGGPPPAFRSWLQPADGMTDADPNAISIALEWHAQPTADEMAALSRAIIFDATGRNVESLVRPAGDFSAFDGRGILEVHFTAPPADGWYTLAVVPSGRFPAAAKWGTASEAGVQFARFRLGSGPRLAAVRYCVGRGVRELYADFSERVKDSAAFRATALEGTGFRCDHGTVDIEEGSATSVRYACADFAADARLSIVAQEQLSGVSGAAVVDAAGRPTGARSVLGQFDMGRVPEMPATGCVVLSSPVPSTDAYIPGPADFSR